MKLCLPRNVATLLVAGGWRIFHGTLQADELAGLAPAQVVLGQRFGVGEAERNQPQIGDRGRTGDAPEGDVRFQGQRAGGGRKICHCGPARDWTLTREC